MKERRNIDDLFKESFENFEATPPADTWDKIAAKLQKKKKDRKIIPIWWRVAGVAALLALLFTIGNSVFGPSDASDQLSEEETNPVKTESVQDTTLPTDNLEDNIQLADDNARDDSEKGDEDKTDNAEDKARKEVFNQKGIEDAVADQDVPDKVKKTDKLKSDQLFKEKTDIGIDEKKEAVADENIDDKVKKQDILDPSVKDKTPLTKDDKIGVANEKEAVAMDEKINKVGIEKTTEDDIIRKEDKVDDMINKEKIVSDKIDTDVAKTDVEKEIKKVEDPNEDKKRSIFDAIEENKEEEAVAVKSSPDDRWEVTPNVGPVYYSSFGEGSSIDPSFADNSQSGDVNFSYGANISYAISDRLSVRTGISNVNLSYTTGDVELGTGPVSSALRSVDYGGRQIVTTAVDKGALRPGNPEGDPFGNITPKSVGEEAFINQSLRYYEVPLELKYSLMNNKFGMHLIGGFSSLFLADNEVSVEAGDFSTVLGEANNLNSLSFTTNIGLGFDYKIGKRLKFNIEPMFKYQLNPYTDSSVDFNPFYLGVYTGLSFKF